MNSYCPQVQTDSTGEWYGNGLRFPTREEAGANVLNLSLRWTAVRDTRVVESGALPNYRWIDNRLAPMKPGDVA